MNLKSIDESELTHSRPGRSFHIAQFKLVDMNHGTCKKSFIFMFFFDTMSFYQLR